MPHYDTSSQCATARSRRRAGLIGTVLLLMAATYYVYVFLRDGGTTLDTAASFSLSVSILFFVLTLVPLSIAIGNHPHPTSVDVTDEALSLAYPDGRSFRHPWESGVVDTALDTREADPKKRRPHGLEATVWVTMPGRHPGTTTIRLAQIIVSGQAFDEIRRRVKRAGFEEREEVRRRVGVFYRYERPTEPGVG